MKCLILSNGLRPANIVTTMPSLLEGMLAHPYSKETVRQFLEDSKKLV